MLREECWNRKINYTASLITLDQCNVESQVQSMIDNGIPMLHLDVLDGHFSPELPLGFRLIEDVMKKFKDKIFMDAHIMCDPPEFFVDKLIDFGVDHINFHYETAPHVDGLLNKIHSNGIRCGVAIKPSTPVSMLECVIEKCDSILVMLFNPGYSWSKSEQQVPYTLKKVDDVYEMIQKRGLDTKIIIDGRISHDNIERFGKKVNMYTCGSTCINKSDIAGSVMKLNEIRTAILQGELDNE